MRGSSTFKATLRSCAGRRVQRIVLDMPHDFRFAPGQYLEVLHPDGPIPLSIASAPWRLPQLHLHYQSSAGVPEAARMDELLGGGAELEVRGPSGDVTLVAPFQAPVLVAAGGTGVAQAMSCIDEFQGIDPGAEVTLLWCADQDTDFYLRGELEGLHAPWLQVVMIADAERSPRNRAIAWLRVNATRFAAQPASASSASQVILAGGPGFVYAAFDALTRAGVHAEQIRSDVFSYAPRS